MGKSASRSMNMLEGPLWNKFLIFAMPIAATGILEQLFNAADIAVVGRFTGDFGTIGIAAVGANSPIIGLIVALFIGVALGANVVIAQGIGSGDLDSVHKAVHTAIVLSVLAGFLVMAVGEAIARPLLAVLHVPEEVMPWALLYLRIYFGGMPVILLYNFETAIFRSVGQTKTPLMALMISGILNVFLNLFFVIVVGMTVDGVAVATVISNACSALFLFWRLMKSQDVIKINVHELRIDPPAMQRILCIGLPAGIQSAAFSIANIVVQSGINSLGTVIMAASSAAFNIEVVCYDIVNSFSQACTTFVGQNFGAGKLDRCRKTLYLSLLEGAIFTAAIVLVVLLFGHQLIYIFNTDPEVVEQANLRLRVIMSEYVFCVMYEVMSGYMRGFGISLLPALITMCGICGTRILWIMTVFRANPSFLTILMVYPISFGLNTALIFITLLILHPAVKYRKIDQAG